MGCCADNKSKCCGISKVVIPAALGGHDGEYAPQNGAYQNTLVYYEASGVSYLYANDGSFERLADGVVATIEVGETTTLTPGSDATVTNRGTKYHALLDFGIPQGEKGDTGTAATISVGTTTTGAPGTNASVTNSGTSSAAVFNFTIPRGDTGATGPEGTVKSEYVTELPAVGDSDTFYLMSKSTNPTGTVQGNPVSINNTQTAGQVTDFELQGGTSQVTLTGKNLFNGGTWRKVYTYSGYPEPPADSNVTIDASDANSVKYSTTTTYRGVESDFIPVQAGQVITLSYTAVTAPNRLWVTQYDGTKTRVGTLNASAQSLGTTTVTTTQDGYITVAFGSTAAGANYEVKDIQLELGPTATTYEPYCGGTPSPNPQFPQNINVVTGGQSITDGTDTYPIALGSIELCKIGTYQDRIYKSGEKWYVEKNVGKTTLDGSEAYIWNYNPGTYSGFYRAADSVLTDGVAKVGDARLSKSSNFTCESTTTAWTGAGKFGFSSTWTMWFELMDNTITNYQGFNTWLSTHNTTVYYPLATATTTQITDSTLISQLEAIKNAELNTGLNAFTNSATSPNLAGEFEIDYELWEKYNRCNVYLYNDDLGDYQILNG